MLLKPTVDNLVGGGVGGAGVHGVAESLRVGGVNLEATAAVGTEVVEVGGVSPVGVDGGIVVESTLVGGGVGEADNVVEVVIQVGVDVVGGDVGGPCKKCKNLLDETQKNNLQDRVASNSI